jgi:hypothetical protein
MIDVSIVFQITIKPMCLSMIACLSKVSLWAGCEITETARIQRINQTSDWLIAHEQHIDSFEHKSDQSGHQYFYIVRLYMDIFIT